MATESETSESTERYIGIALTVLFFILILLIIILIIFAIVDYSKEISNKNALSSFVKSNVMGSPEIEYISPLNNGIVTVKGSNFNSQITIRSPELKEFNEKVIDVHIVSDKEFFFIPRDGLMTFFLLKDDIVCKNKNGDYLYRVENII